MNFRVIRLLFPGLAAAASLFAQSPGVGITGLSVGYVYNPGVGVQPILGITGSSTFGPPLNIAGQTDAAWVSPQQDYIVIRSGASYSTASLTGALDSIATTPVSGLTSAGDQLVFSPTGASFAILDKTVNHIQVVSGMPANPSAPRDVDLTQLANGTLNVMAVSDDGGALAGGFVVDGSNASVWLLNPGADTRSLVAVHHPGALAFGRQNRDLLIADDIDNKITRIHDVTGTGDIAQIAAPTDGIAGPVAVAFSKSNNRAFVVNANSMSIIILDLTGTNMPQTFTCPCVPGALYRLGGDSVFRLMDPGAAPLWLFDADNSIPRFVFVPPYAASQPAQ